MDLLIIDAMLPIAIGILTTMKLIFILVAMEQTRIPVIYQDHHLLIVNKPPDLVMHPTYKHADGTMWDALLAYQERQGADDWQPPVLEDEPDWLQAPVHVREMRSSSTSHRRLPL